MSAYTRANLLVLCLLCCVCSSFTVFAEELRFRIEFATYLGGTRWEQAREVLVAKDGSIIIGAQTASPNMPTTAGVVQPNYAGDDPSLGHPGIYGGDCYLARFSSDGRRLLAATYFGGSKQERNVYGMELDQSGNIVITSMTRSTDIPTTKGCFQPKHGGAKATTFVAKLSADFRQIIWCTYLGGSGDESPRGGLTLDQQDNVIVFGTCASPDFPTTPGAWQTTLRGKRDAFVAKLSADGSRLVWSTLFGGSGEDYMLGGRVDSQGNVYFAGHTTSTDLPATGSAQPKHGGMHDGYIVKLAASGKRVVYCTYIGGRANEFPEHRLWLGDDGCVLLPGVTASADFPTTTGVLRESLQGKTDAFLCKISPMGDRLVFSTLIGGSGDEFSLMPVCDKRGRIFLVGRTSSRDLPVTPGAIQPTYGGGSGDGWFAVFDPTGSRLLYCTYLGGSGDDMIRGLTLTENGEVFLVGHTASADFPVTRTAFQTRFGGGGGDAFLVRLTPQASN